jgi:hypothetical protein
MHVEVQLHAFSTQYKIKAKFVFDEISQLNMQLFVI